MNPQYFLHSEGGGFKPHVVADPAAIEFLIIDLFCGAGGTTIGFDMAKILGKKCALVIACVNHDPKALRSHWENHPEVVHFEEDIRTLDLGPLVTLAEAYRILYPNAKLILWASLECTNFSKAKGGQPRDADSRTLADHLDRYVIALNPDYIQIENVVEFMSWGPLDANGKPVSKRSGADWLRWREHINNHGYRDEWKEMNSADFGAYTSRNRLFGCFAKHDLPIVWPEPTHAKKPVKESLFGGGLHKWKAVKDVLDFDDEGESIFTREKPLVDNSLERIYAGLIKYVAGGKDKFLSVYNSGKPESRNTSVDSPCRTVLTSNTHSLVQTSFIAKYYSGDPNGQIKSVDVPADAILCKDHHSVVSASFLTKYFSGKPEGKVIPVTGPAGTITCFAGQTLVQPVFIAKYYGSGGQLNSIEEPASCVTARENLSKVQMVWIDKTYTGKDNHQSIDQPAGVVMVNDHHQLVQTQWIDRNFSGGGKHSSVENPAGSITAVPKLNLCKVKPFIMDTNYGNIGSSIDEPKKSLLASRRYSYIINPSHGGCCTSTDAPSPVIIARQDKSPLYIAQVEEGQNVMVFSCPGFLTEEDLFYLESLQQLIDGKEVTVPEKSIRIKIIEFMALYGIADIKMRMLKVSELKLIQGFPADYKLYGNQSDQKKFIGNSVVPHVVCAWCETMAAKIREIRRAA